jgi:ubiquinone/menaquinone biosynthesis C-methylase UbiE
MQNIYESDIYRSMPDGSMHPGGLRLTDRAVRLAGLSKGMTVADIGCGTGVTAAHLGRVHGLDVTGLDISRALINEGLAANPGLRLIQWDCETLPFEDESLDAVFFECTLSVIGNHASVLAHCRQALRPSGLVIISEPCLKAGAEASSGLMTADGLKAAVQRVGFAVIACEDHTAALKTFAAELAQRVDGLQNISCFMGCTASGSPRLRDLCYTLLIARKI